MTSRRLLLTAALCSVLPDVDSVGFFAGIPYASLLGHRGLSHSLLFALLLASCALALAKWLHAKSWWAFTLVFLSTISHGILDAFTDGGLGVAFFSPFSNQRFFFPWRPIPVSAIGISELFSSSGIYVLSSELLLIWLPCLLVAVAAQAARRRSGLATSVWPSVMIGTILALASTIGGAYAGVVGSGPYTHLRPSSQSAMLAEAIENLETQAEKIAARPGASCPQDFSALETSRTLRISMFYGYDDHGGKVYDRLNANAMSHVLTSKCRGQLSTCGFSLVARSKSATTLVRGLAGRRVEVNLFTSSLADDASRNMSLVAAYREQEKLSRAVKARFYRELLESDVVFYMGHSRLGGSIGFDAQTGVTTLVNAVLRRRMLPVLEALRQRPTKLKIIGMFSCQSNRYFHQDFQGANPSLSLILTTGEINYGPAEQASLGALEAVLSKNCGYAFHESMISADEPDPEMTYLFRGR